MKGQTVNIDWTVGLALFLMSLAAGITILASGGYSGDISDQYRRKTSLIYSEIFKATEINGKEAPLIVRTPVEIDKIPLDQRYNFPEEATPGTGSMKIASHANISGDSIKAVVEGSNNTYDFSYFFSSVSPGSQENDIEAGEWMNNSRISVKPGSPGLESLRIEGNKLLNTEVDLGSTNYSVAEKEIHASTLDGRLKIYNGSPELILENPVNAVFRLKNLSTLYWRPDNDTTELVGTGSFESGDTTGLTVASSYGITFLGNLHAEVSKPDPETVKVNITAPRVRIFLHDSGYVGGRHRILFHERAEVFFGAERIIKGIQPEKLERLKNLNKSVFDSKIQLNNFNYNISIGSLKRGEEIPLKTVIVDQRPQVLLGAFGNYSRIDGRVAVWR